MQRDQSRDGDPHSDENAHRDSVKEAEPRRQFCTPLGAEGQIPNLSQLGRNAEMVVEAERAQNQREYRQDPVTTQKARNNRKENSGCDAVQVKFRENRTDQRSRDLGCGQNRKSGRCDDRPEQQISTEPATE